MIVVLAPGAETEGAEAVLARLRALGLEGRIVRTDSRAAIHVVRGPSRRARALLADPQVAGIVPTSGPRVRREGRRFYPYHALRMGAGGLAGLALLVALAGFFPPLGASEHGEPSLLAPWPAYLAPLRGLYRLLPAELAWLAPGAALALVALVLALPWLDRTRGSGMRARWPVLAAGLLVLGGIAALAVVGLGEPAVTVRAVLLAVALGTLAARARAQESCAVCHGDVAHAEAGGAHALAGIDCIACHGGTPGVLDAASAHAGRRALPSGPRAGVELCGGCHADPERMRGFGLRTDQLLLYRTSSHGRRLAAEDDPDVATCASCHGAHGVLPVRDPRSSAHPLRQAETCGRCHADEPTMNRHGLSTEPSREFPASVHGRALLEQGLLSSPSCAGCHGAHGATPPRVAEVGRVCGGCHAAVDERFRASPHRAASEAGTLEECISCHGSHAVGEPSTDMLVGDAAGRCGACHAQDVAATGAGETMRALFADYDASLVSAEAALDAAERRGAFAWRERDGLAEARSVRGSAGPAVHALDPRELDELLDAGRARITDTLDGLRREERALADRRVLVAVFVGVLLLLAAVLWIHAREVAGRADGEPGLFSRARRARDRREASDA